MKTNISKTDTIIRLIIAVIFIAYGIMYQSWWGLVGVIPLMTALIGVCPIYGMLGFSTSKNSRIFSSPKKINYEK
ncbi:hypothetical protein Asal01_00146 [Fodinibius salicampi]|uniref:YgaP family membrane protein n=1 Tax=Fodinibius salicampi TaxID=1920655 RepID=UPI0030A3AFE0